MQPIHIKEFLGLFHYKIWCICWVFFSFRGADSVFTDTDIHGLTLPFINTFTLSPEQWSLQILDLGIKVSTGAGQVHNMAKLGILESILGK